jgi:hypothetical protein
MPVTTPGQLAFELHNRHQRLKFLLDSLMPPSHCSEPQRTVPSANQVSDLLSELSRAGQLLRDCSMQKDSEVEREMFQYRGQVQRLRDLLPGMRCILLAERARLECERKRLNATAHWARMSRHTL